MSSSVPKLQLMLLLAGCCLLLVAAAATTTASAARLKRGALTDDAERLLRQGASIDTNNVNQLVELVARNGAEECLSRVICELSSQSRAYGDEGARFAQSLLRFRQSKHPKVKQYLEALGLGIKVKSLSECSRAYPSCSHQTSEVVAVGNRILRTG